MIYLNKILGGIQIMNFLNQQQIDRIETFFEKQSYSNSKHSKDRHTNCYITPIFKNFTLYQIKIENYTKANLYGWGEYKDFYTYTVPTKNLISTHIPDSPHNVNSTKQIASLIDHLMKIVKSIESTPND